MPIKKNSKIISKTFFGFLTQCLSSKIQNIKIGIFANNRKLITFGLLNQLLISGSEPKKLIINKAK